MTFLCCPMVFGQPAPDISTIVSRLNQGDAIPEELLTRKSLVLHDPAISLKELESFQSGFQRCGIDAVLYVPYDIPTANAEVNRLFINYASKREVYYFIILTKKESLYDLVVAPFDGKKDWFTEGHAAWHLFGTDASAITQSIFRLTAGKLKKRNLLINETPETQLSLNTITGNRNEFFALDLKVDRLAIVRSGLAAEDKIVEEYFAKNYPFKFEFFNPGVLDKDIRSKGFLYILKYVHARAGVAMRLLGYEPTKIGKTLPTISFTDSGQAEIKNVSAETTVWKFYFKHLENGNHYLGTKWDADEDKFQALKNHLIGFKTELRIK
ncbi:MAG: hypothetical protein FJZ78_04265 [Bacteroidetes bacterium]|nr:hypothetical protein [Bacteroidota bacterium]